MTPQAWMVVGERGYKAVFLDQAVAIAAAADHRGAWRSLLTDEDVQELMRQVYAKGVEKGREIERASVGPNPPADPGVVPV